MKKLSPFKRERKIHEEILKCVKLNPNGLTITQISKKTKFSRKTVEKHLQILEKENEIYMRQLGPARVYYPVQKKRSIKSLISENREISFSVFEKENEFFLLLQEKIKEDDVWKAKGSLLIPLKMTKRFMQMLGEFLSAKIVKEIEHVKKSKKK